MTDEFAHFLITRFNVGFKTRYPDPEVRKKWMDSRIRVFESLTLPTVLAQTVKNFKWLIVFDPSVKEDYPEFIQKLEAIEFCEPIYFETNEFTVGDFPSVLKERFDPAIRHVITTRLDSDDAISDDYIEEIQKHFVPGETYIVNFTDGLGYSSDGDVSLFVRNLVAFASFYECLDKGELKTIQCGSHASLKRIAPVRHVFGKPMYIYYHHDDNISNNTLFMTSLFKLPLDFIAQFLCRRIDVLNKHLRYSYRIPIRTDNPKFKAFHIKV